MIRHRRIDFEKRNTIYAFIVSTILVGKKEKKTIFAHNFYWILFVFGLLKVHVKC